MAAILKRLDSKLLQLLKRIEPTTILKIPTVSLDDVHGVGKFVEIEKQAFEGENFEDALDEIFGIYKQIGIEEGFERRSYLELWR